MNADHGHTYDAVMDAIDWNTLSMDNTFNLDALSLGAPRIDWDSLTELFTPAYDYIKMKQDNDWLLRELNAHIFHPNRIRQWLEDGNEIEDYLN